MRHFAVHFDIHKGFTQIPRTIYVCLEVQEAEMSEADVMRFAIADAEAQIRAEYNFPGSGKKSWTYKSIEEAKIRALTWKEPFATLMLHGKKETRTRATKVRGLVLICSAITPFTEQQVSDRYGVKQAIRCYERVRRPYTTPGKAIAVGELVDCRPMQPEDEDDCFVAYNPELWVWVFQNVKPIKPFRYKGSQGWTILTEDIVNQIKYI